MTLKDKIKNYEEAAKMYREDEKNCVNPIQVMAAQVAYKTFEYIIKDLQTLEESGPSRT